MGNILNKNTDSGVPCHRVIRSDGSTGGYNRGENKKVELLSMEDYKKSSEMNADRAVK